MQLIHIGDTATPIPFLAINSNDHRTGVTGLVPGVSLSLTISKGGSFTAPAGTISEIGFGWYKLTPASADVSTRGPLLLHWSGSGIDDGDKECFVGAIGQQVWDEARSTHTASGTFGGDAVQAPAGFSSLIIDAGSGGVLLAPGGSAPLTEGYAANGSSPTLAQLMYMIWSKIAQESVAGVVVTTKKLDGVTTAMTFTLNDSAQPTSIARTT